MNKKSDAETAEWLEAVRLGGVKACTHFRRLLLSGKELDKDDRQGLADLLSHIEGTLLIVYAQNEQTIRALTQAMCDKIADDGNAR